jgi:hypothetical protein
VGRYYSKQKLEILTSESAGVQEFRSSGVQEFRSSGVQEFRSSFWAAISRVKLLPAKLLQLLSQDSAERNSMAERR